MTPTTPAPITSGTVTLSRSLLSEAIASLHKGQQFAVAGALNDAIILATEQVQVPSGEREAFERYVQSQCAYQVDFTDQTPNGQYKDMYRQTRWEGFQAGAAWRATLAQRAGAADKPVAWMDEASRQCWPAREDVVWKGARPLVFADAAPVAATADAAPVVEVQEQRESAGDAGAPQNCRSNIAAPAGAVAGEPGWRQIVTNVVKYHKQGLYSAEDAIYKLRRCVEDAESAAAKATPVLQDKP